MHDEPTKAAWAAFLGRYEWEYFLTITFRLPREPHHAQSTLSQIGNIIERHSNGRYFLGSELHHSRTLHVHGLFTPRKRTTAPSSGVTARALWGVFLEEFGRSQVRRVLTNEAVTRYCSKYCTKDLTEWKLRI